jgi:hypothetical protein
MANHVLTTESIRVEVRSTAAPAAARLDRTTTAFGLSAAVTCIFNTLLAWVKDAYEPLNNFMASLTGHHWTTHGIVDVLLFVALGFVFMNTGIPDRLSAKGLTRTLVASVIGSGLGLLVWFVLV